MYKIKYSICLFISFACFSVHCRQTRGFGSKTKGLVKELSINSSVSIRYANVLVRSLVENLESEDTEVSFQVRIPQEAYITSFVIVTNEKTIKASIKEKNAASEEYNKAKEDGVSAGTVTQQTDVTDDIDRDIFKVKVNVAAQTSLEFRLQYEELLQKKAGKYSQKVYVDSDHVIPKLEVICEFKEKQKFKQLTYQTPTAIEKVYINDEKFTNDGYFIRKVVWAPNEKEQETARFGLAKPFEIAYELDPPENGGLVYLNDNGEFVHMFSTPCDETKIMVKQLVFVLDISGSMANDPIMQVRKTMEEILTRLRSNDYFNIVIFNEKAIMWKVRFQQATAYNVANAKAFIKSEVIAKGSTNINEALLQAVALFGQDSGSDEDSHQGQIVVFLTDGSPTNGVTNRDQIRSNVRATNHYEGEKCCKAIIFTIAFGAQADVNFLRVLAHENEGTLTVIREVNEEGPLLEIYNEVENPFFKNIEFTFMANNEVVPKENITRTQFRQYDCGNELVVAGWTFPEAEIQPLVVASGIRDRVIFDGVPTVRARNVYAETVSRLLFYEKVRQLLIKAETATDPYEKKSTNEQALKLSLEYGFVTPLTSLVVTDYSPAPKNVWTGSNTAAARSGSSSRSSSKSLPSSIFSDVQYDADDTNNFYSDLDASLTENSKLNTANKCAYSLSMFLIVLMKRLAF